MGTPSHYDLVTEYNALRIGHLIRQGCFPERNIKGVMRFADGQTVGIEVYGDYVLFRYQVDGDMRVAQVRTVTTATNFNGHRRWFACPQCDRRVGVVYFAWGGLRCRTCLHLVYPSTRERDFGRAVDKRDRLYRRLGAHPRDGTRHIGKPKGMHWKTFRRKLQEIAEAEDAVSRALIPQITMLRRHIL